MPRLLLTLAPLASAAPVPLQNATATYSQFNPSVPNIWGPDSTIDGAASGAFTSWAIFDPAGVKPQTIVWETASDVGEANGLAFLMNLHHQDFVPSPGQNLGRFRLSYTTDDRSQYADGLRSGGDVSANWKIIDLATFSSSGGESMTKQPDGSVLVGGVSSAYPTYLVSGSIPEAGITGFRLEALSDPSLPFGGPGRELSNGNFHLSEFGVSTAEQGSQPEAPLPPDVQIDPFTVSFDFTYDPGPNPENPETIWISSCPVWAAAPETVESFVYTTEPTDPSFWDITIPEFYYPVDPYEVWTDYGSGAEFDGYVDAGATFVFDGPYVEGGFGDASLMPEVHYFELRNIQGRAGSPMFVPGFQFMGAGNVHLTIQAQVIPEGKVWAGGCVLLAFFAAYAGPLRIRRV